MEALPPPPGLPSKQGEESHGPVDQRSSERRPLGLPRGYLFLAPLALVAIWGHRYPAGIDLPQHANLVRLWVELGKGPIEYNELYRVNPFTPYVLAYALAYPFAKWVSAAAGIKVVLSFAALGTPWALTRWLRAVGGELQLGLLGFPIVFGFAYLWGFLSHVLALPILFFYLASFEASSPADTGALRRGAQGLATMLWGALLFFCHGVTFGVAVVSVGLGVLLGPRTLRSWARGLHLVPLGVLALAWLRLREGKASEPSNWWFIDLDRLITLFSGLFWPKASVAWAGLTAAALLLAWLVARPRMNRTRAAWIPFAVVTAGFLILPEYLASTYLVGTRFCVYVQVFALALWGGGSGRNPRRLTGLVVALVAASLVLLNVRLWRFNVEMEGFREVAKAVLPGGDVQTYLTKLGGNSEVFGPRELSEIPGWVAAENGTLIENDSAHYFQMPILRRARRFPSRYRYVFARGDDRTVRAKMNHAFPGAVIAARSGPWFLFEQKPLVTGTLMVVRSQQDSGSLGEDQSVDGTPLSIGGVAYEHGLGTHARSFIRVRSLDGRGRLEGACGVDDSAPPESALSCRVTGERGEVLWGSGRMSRGAAAHAFAVPLDENHEALLEVLSEGSNVGDHADWVDLR